MENKNTPSHIKTSIIIYDWDDTIIPTTYIMNNRKIPEKYMNCLEFIQKNVYDIITHCILLHRTQYIVTNSQEKWVDDCLKRFFPKCSKLISKYVKIISASDNYIDRYPNNPYEWKRRAIKHIIHHIKKQHNDIDIISLGDAINDRNIIIKLGKENQNVNVKHVKFMESPSPMMLSKELELFLSKLDFLHNLETDVDFKLILTS